MSSQVFPIYPSQLPSFKAKAKQLASYIEEKSACTSLSSYKRNDLLSMGLSYKGHSDLVQSAKFRQSSDTNAPLFLFVNKNRVCKRIASIFSSQLTHVTRHHIEEAIDEMVKIEQKELFSKRLRKTSTPHQVRSNILPITDAAMLLTIPKLLEKHYGTITAGVWRLGVRFGLNISELLNIKLDDVNDSVITIRAVRYGKTFQISLGVQEMSIVNKLNNHLLK